MTFFDKEHVKREGTKVFPPLIPLTMLLAAWGLDGMVAAIDLEPSWFTGVFGTVGLTIGIGLMTWGILQQSRHGTDPNPFNTTSALVTDGPYRFTRNPIYVADLILQAGIALLLAFEWGLLLLPVTWAGLRFLVIRNEERYLAEVFGDEYAAYRQRVRRWV